MADRKPLARQASSPARRDSDTRSINSMSSSNPRDRSVSPSVLPKDSSLRLAGPTLRDHRQSFSDSLRGHPPSPRARRQPSLTQTALQELLDHPPVASPGDPAFVGRDWKTIAIGELIDDQEVRFVELDTWVEAATNVLIDTGASVILIRNSPDDTAAVGAFEYSDLNAYLLLVTGLAQPEEADIRSFNELAKKAREGNKIPIKDVKDLGKKEPLVFLPHTARLTKAVELLGSGIHRIIVVKEGTTEVKGILSQLRVVKFLWENGKSFPSIDQLYSHYIRDLNIGSQHVISIAGDRPLTDALELLNNEGISSLAVTDSKLNVIGNISTVDVKHLTRSSSLPLLRSTCIHFISIILSDRGVNDGQDSFPVFYVNPLSTLAHTVAKLVATQSHRMWVVDAPSPATSTPPTPITQYAVVVPPQPSIYSPPTSATTTTTTTVSLNPVSPSISAASLSAIHTSGRLSGVVSLTDILNLFARSNGLSPIDPGELRRQRRRSSSSSLHRPSLDSVRSGSVSDIRR